jgi:hypothetical protein
MVSHYKLRLEDVDLLPLSEDICPWKNVAMSF